jgi:hypothetical protein
MPEQLKRDGLRISKGSARACGRLVFALAARDDLVHDRRMPAAVRAVRAVLEKYPADKRAA